MPVQMIPVEDDEAGIRLDRWFRRRFPDLPHGRLEKLLRDGQVRVDGTRARANMRLLAGQQIRVPPVGDRTRQPIIRPPVDRADERQIRESVLYCDEETIVINKPPGLAVQGGSRLSKHVDGMLDALRFGGHERPRLVHRLDKDTSGALVLARTATSAARLAAAFRGRSVQKLYWALVVGVPQEQRGSIDFALAKKTTRGSEKVTPTSGGQAALTNFSVIDTVSNRGAWLALEPKTGRTHQLRAHLAAIGVPIHGDGKYGGRAAFLDGDAISAKLHLHARALRFQGVGGSPIRVVAPLPPHMLRSWEIFGFDPNRDADPFVSVAA